MEMELIFPLAVGKMGVGGLATPWVREEGRDASLDKRHREKVTSPACGVTVSSWGAGSCV